MRAGRPRRPPRGGGSAAAIRYRGHALPHRRRCRRGTSGRDRDGSWQRHRESSGSAAGDATPPPRPPEAARAPSPSWRSCGRATPMPRRRPGGRRPPGGPDRRPLPPSPRSATRTGTPSSDAAAGSAPRGSSPRSPGRRGKPQRTDQPPPAGPLPPPGRWQWSFGIPSAVVVLLGRGAPQRA